MDQGLRYGVVVFVGDLLFPWGDLLELLVMSAGSLCDDSLFGCIAWEGAMVLDQLEFCGDERAVSAYPSLSANHCVSGLYVSVVCIVVGLCLGLLVWYYDPELKGGGKERQVGDGWNEQIDSVVDALQELAM